MLLDNCIFMNNNKLIQTNCARLNTPKVIKYVINFDFYTFFQFTKFCYFHGIDTLFYTIKPNNYTKNLYNTGAAKKIAAVKLVIGGGPETINHVYQTIINEIPVIVFKETSQAAALFAYAFELPPLEVCNLAEIEEHQKLIDMIGLEYPDLTRRQKAKYYNKIMKCMKQKKYV